VGLKVKAPSSSERDEVKQNPPWRPIADWLRMLIPSGTNVEMRTIGVSRHGHKGVHAESSHYVQEGDQMERLAKAALSINCRSEGIYWTLNPLLPGPALEGRAATDADVHSRRWLLIDCDPERVVSYGSKKVSATDDEKQLAWMTAIQVKNALLERRWPEPILADSGNGYHLLYRVNLPADDGGLVKRVLQGIAAEFDCGPVKIDTSVFNPSRICKLYGSVSRKGPNTVERPHRASAVISAPSNPVAVSTDLLEAIAAPVPTLNPRGRNEDPAEQPSPPPTVVDEIFPKPKPKGLIAKAGRVDPLSRAEIYADRCQAAISGQNGHSQTLKVAVAVGPGFNLSEEEAFRVLWQHYNPRCEPPWSEADLQRKVREAYKVETQRGWQLKVSHVASGPSIEKKGEDTTERNEANEDPHRLARLALDTHFRHAKSGWPILAYWAEGWNRWHDGSWRTVSQEEISAEVTRIVKAEYDRIALEILKPAKHVTRAVVGNVLQALKDLTLLPTWECPKQPTWLEAGSEFGDPIDYLSAKNAIVHLPSLVDGQPCTFDPTPRFFSPTNLGYNFDPAANPPEAWLNFLSDLWPDDPQAIACLQEWMGYLLTPDTSQSKILMLIGPKRSGKGTIGRVIQGLVGSPNVAAPTLASMERNFGLSALIGKLIAIIGDARLSGRSDSQAIVERLLSISGQDTQTIDRKNQSLWTGNLSTRFVLISNELPRLPDASGALPSRMILLQMTKSFYGSEDTTLTEKLLSERSAILLWAIAGWARLRSRGHFVQPPSGQEYMDEFLSLSSPILSFIEEECVVGPDYRVPIADLYAAWKKFCEQRGRDHPGDEGGFGKNLKAACTSIKVTRPRKGDGRIRAYEGITLASSQGEIF